MQAGDYYRKGRMRCKVSGGGEGIGEGSEEDCQCVEGYKGEECEVAVCPSGCRHGQCLRPGYCTCEEGWKGKSCDEATCRMRCVHGHCLYPNFCRCNAGWHGRRCDKQCSNGEFSQRRQQCLCSPGWEGVNCKVALCDKFGCAHGFCAEPDVCKCYIAWEGKNCTSDLIKTRAEQLTNGLVFKSKRWPALTVHNSGKKFDEAWKAIKKWTTNLEDDWKFGRTRFTNELPMNDTLHGRLEKKYKTCVAVGNSGSLLKVKAGSVIDSHELVLRYNDGPTRGYEEYVGRRTTIRLLNRKYADSLVAKYQLRPPPPPFGKPAKIRPKRASNEITLMWRAESYQQYAVLRRILPDDRIYMVSPQFLIPLFTFFKSVMQRMSESGLAWESPQSTPHGFVGIGLLIQICDRITLYGFEEPTREPGSKYHYYNKIEPLDPHANDVEFAVLRILDKLGMVRLCPEEELESCVGEDQVSFNLV